MLQRVVGEIGCIFAGFLGVHLSAMVYLGM